MTKATDNNGQYWYIGQYTIHRSSTIANETFVVAFNNRSIGVFSNLSAAISEVLIEQGWTGRHVSGWAEQIFKDIA
jgi:hypothetical protein